ncbi:hypothetical protein L2E82_46537 [Cichorium intybus]|uniref:Uncharacterized protein n=1 Tax=Cichorium intybus TaxID=13427 RepID=A0ACB8YTA1_CICIN|nr:hypothetical protein L1887_26248 [Cichorium endivia]KAI3688742.1 hypothetical protein L2E82_46537 [Cichorium intybus]
MFSAQLLQVFLLVDCTSLPSPPSTTPDEPLPTRILLNLNFSTAMFDFTSVMIISDPMPAAVGVLICGYTMTEKQPQNVHGFDSFSAGPSNYTKLKSIAFFDDKA